MNIQVKWDKANVEGLLEKDSLSPDEQIDLNPSDYTYGTLIGILSKTEKSESIGIVINENNTFIEIPLIRLINTDDEDYGDDYDSLE